MHKNVRESLENILVASAIYSEECYLALKEKDVISSDFESKLCSLIFDIIDTYFKKETIIPSNKIIGQEVLVYLYKNIEQSKVTLYKSKFDRLLESRETDIVSFNKHLDNFYSIKLKKGIVEILNNARDIAESKDVSEVLDYILDAYVTSFKTKEDVDGINFYRLMRKDLDEYNPCLERGIEINNASKTGIFHLDTKYLNGGVLEGNMCIVAGRPGSGKTTLIKNIGLNNARDSKQTLFISLEMSKEQIAQGYYAQLARVELGKILKRELSVDDYNKMLNTLDKEENSLENYHIIDRDSLTVSQLINLLIRYKKQHNIEVFLLDYVQQIRLPNGSIPKNETEYSLVSELIRTIIKKLKLHGYICAQVNRDCEKRPDKHPIASDLRSSGKLEQDAAYILTTYRDELYNKETEHPRTMDITVAKNRFGPIGMVRCMFEGEYQNIGNLLDGDLGD